MLVYLKIDLGDSQSRFATQGDAYDIEATGVLLRSWAGYYCVFGTRNKCIIFEICPSDQSLYNLSQDLLELGPDPPHSDPVYAMPDPGKN